MTLYVDQIRFNMIYFSIESYVDIGSVVFQKKIHLYFICDRKRCNLCHHRYGDEWLISLKKRVWNSKIEFSVKKSNVQRRRLSYTSDDSDDMKAIPTTMEVMMLFRNAFFDNLTDQVYVYHLGIRDNHYFKCLCFT